MTLYFVGLSLSGRVNRINNEFSFWVEEYNTEEHEKYFKIVFENEDDEYDFDKPLPRGNTVYKPEKFSEETVQDDLMSGYSFKNHISYFEEFNIGVYTTDVKYAKNLLLDKMIELLDKKKKELDAKYKSLEKIRSTI